MGLVDGLKQYSGYNIANDAVHGRGQKTVQDMSANDVVGNALGLPHFGDPDAVPDTSGLVDAQKRAQSTQDFYRNRLVNLSPSYDPGQSAYLRAQGNAAIGGLQSAAAGDVPSAAELQLRQQASRNAAQNFGAAAALGGRSPGMALRQATLGATQTQADTNNQAAALRANEMATARGQLVGAIGSQQNAEQGLRAGDINAQQPLITADLGALNANTNAATGVANANAQVAAAKNAKNAGLLGGLLSAI